MKIKFNGEVDIQASDISEWKNKEDEFVTTLITEIFEGDGIELTSVSATICED